MSVDRPVSLDLRLPDARAQDGAGTAPRDGRPRGEADPDARQRFEQALRAPVASGGADPADGALRAPFGLFAPGLPGALPRPGGSAAPPLPASVMGAVERLMVEDRGGGGRMLRMELKDDVLPGVVVVLQEAEGRLTVEFICAAEASRQRLCAAVQDHAAQLAHGLGRDVLVRVVTDDPEDPCAVEAAASP